MWGDIVKSDDPKAKGEEGGIEGDNEGEAYGGDLGLGLSLSKEEGA